MHAKQPSCSTEVIDLAFGFDANYAPHAAAALKSIEENTPGAAFRVTLLHDGIDGATKRKVEASAPYAEFRWIHVTESDFPEYHNIEHFSRAILFRLGLERFAPEGCARLIYVDTDTICLRDIRELWTTDLQGAPLGAVKDCYVNGDEFARNWDLGSSPGGYFNSGILLFDMEKVRAGHFLARAMDWVAEHVDEVRFADQDALNFVFHDQWHHLDRIWNVQRHMVIPSLFPELSEDMLLSGAWPGIVHFTGPEKPWRTDLYHPWSWLYWHQIDHTPFRREISRRFHAGLRARLRIWVRWMRNRPVRHSH